MKKEHYEKMVKQVTPKHKTFTNMCKAFWVGGLICVISQGIQELFINFGLDKETAGNWLIIILIFISMLLTGWGVYPKIAKYAGAGTLVPITGFANSVVASAIEFKKEGQVFGIGSKIFTIAGPVILYGIFYSWLLGLIYWIVGLI